MCKVECSPLNKERKLYAEFAKSYGKNKSSINQSVVKKGKEMCTNFSGAPQTAKVIATVHDKYLVKMEKVLNLWVSIFQKLYF